MERLPLRAKTGTTVRAMIVSCGPLNRGTWEVIGQGRGVRYVRFHTPKPATFNIQLPSTDFPHRVITVIIVITLIKCSVRSMTADAPLITCYCRILCPHSRTHHLSLACRAIALAKADHMSLSNISKNYLHFTHKSQTCQ
jgi:hypothetical protein